MTSQTGLCLVPGLGTHQGTIADRFPAKVLVMGQAGFATIGAIGAGTQSQSFGKEVCA